MTIVINQLMLDKLVHEIKEIRIRTLHDIEGKLKRAILEHTDIKFSAPALFKNLIRWYGLDPICEELMVLELMALLLASEYASEIVQFFTAERIIKELKKIDYLIGSNPEFADLITLIIEQVGVISSSSLRQDTESVALSEMESTMATMIPIPGGGSACSRRQELIESLESRWQDKETLYTTIWEKQSKAVTNRLESFNDSLLMDEAAKNLELALGYMIPYTKDFPADFFLRPPYICLSLFRLIRLRKVSVRAGFFMLLHLVASLRKRVRQRCTAALYMPPESINADEKTQISTCAFVYEIFRLGMELLKEISADLDMMSSNMIFIVLDNLPTFSLEGACSLMENLPGPRFVELRSDLGYLMKHFRQEWESNSKNENARTRYRMVLQILINSIDHWKTLHNDKDPTVDILPAKGAHIAAEYNASDFATMNSTGHQRALEELDDTWVHEMHLALLDYPLKQVCPSTYQHLLALTVTCKEDIQRVRVLGDIPCLFDTVVELLRAGPGAMDMSADELLAIGPGAIKTLFLHRSFGLMRMVMNAVSKCASSMTEDVPLWDTIESITVSLLAERDEEIRCEAYTLCMDMMKEFIGQLDEAAILTRRTLTSTVSPKLRALGIPLSLRIVTEIICFGYTSSNSKIRQCAETMLLFLCNMKLFLRDHWSSVEEILLPIAPLLQTAAIGIEETKLRKAVMGMFHPDFGLPWLDMLQGNLRLLFHEESTIRTEALTRVFFLLSTVEQSEARLSPRIEHIGDTIPNELCLVKLPYDTRRQQMVDVYEVSSVRPLLDVLEQERADPALRRSTLTQLNAMAEDPVLCELIHNSSGWVLVLTALYNALQEDHSFDYPDAAIPAVGILTKLCFSVVSFRRFLGTNENAYHLIVRALFCFHHMPVFRVECSALLYLLLFADCSTGAGTMVSLPVLCRSSSFRVPFVCHFHWEHSPFRQENLLEVIVQGGAAGGLGALEPAWGGGESILRIDERTLLQQVSTDAGRKAGGFSVSQLSTYREYLMRYIRFAFADIWFQGLDNVLRASKNPKQSVSVDHELAPIEYSGRVAGTPAFRFNAALRLTKQDILWLKIVDTASTLRKATRRIASAKTHADVYGGLAILEANMFFPVNSAQCFPEQKTIIDTMQRYFVSLPATPSDQQLLVAVLSTVGNLIDFGQHEIRDWVIDLQSSEDGNFFLKLLYSETSSVELYAKTVYFLRVVLLSMIPSDFFRQVPEVSHRPTTPPPIWDIEMFDAVLKQLDIEMEAINFGRVFHLVSLLELLADPIAAKHVDVGLIIPKLLQHIQNVRSDNYIASSLVLSCLITIRKLLGEDPVTTLKSSHYKLLLTLCGHCSPMIRACAWNVLAKLAIHENYAKMILQHSVYLPGGIHACCVTTLLDEREAALVRQSAAILLANLFYNLFEKNGNVKESLLPQDRAYKSKASDMDGPLKPVVTMLSKQGFFELSAASLVNFTPKEFLVEGHRAMPVQQAIVSADLVRAFALVYRSLLEMESYDFASVLLKKGCLRGLVDCVAKHPLDNPSIAQWLMVSEVCRLLMWCNEYPHREELLKDVRDNQLFFARIISLLKPSEDCHDIAKNPMLATKINVMRFLNELMGRSELCKRPIRAAFAKANMQRIARMISEGISTQAEEITNQRSHTTVAPQHSGSGHIFKQLLAQFKSSIFVSSLDPERRKIYTAMQFMLRSSSICRQVAWEGGLLSILLGCFNSLHAESLGGLTYPEFVRKYGEVKKLPYLIKLVELMKTVVCWIGSPGEGTRLRQDEIDDFCRIVLIYWSWINTSHALKMLFLQTLTVLSVDSILVCKALAATFPGHPHSIMKLLIVTVTAETARVKGPKCDMPTLSLAMRVLMSCCSCQEGRSTISKMHMLDNISKLHPSVTKMQKPWPEVTRLWLDFWELYSQHEDGSEVKHLTVLGALVRRSDFDLRQYALFIIRNMTFVPANRPALLASSDYMFMLQNALKCTATRNEQLTAAVTVWKMIANNQKGRAAIKASPLVRHIGALVNHHSMEAGTITQDELWDILMTVYRILQA
uniref:Rotatin N-terminal domain-containing protein n=1 Tax=Anopheles atroparvus TaxID=41427 RepID=A0A182JF50_ANOAO